MWLTCTSAGGGNAGEVVGYLAGLISLSTQVRFLPPAPNKKGASPYRLAPFSVSRGRVIGSGVEHAACRAACFP